MGGRPPRAALWGLVVLVLAGALASVPGALAGSTPTYTLLGYAQQPGGLSAPPVPSGVTVDLISSATHQVYQTKTLAGTSGQFNFSSAGTAPALQPGWWGTWVPPQAHVTVGGSTVPDAILPQNQSPAYQYESSTNLTSFSSQVTISGVALAPYISTIWGNVSYSGRAAGGAVVQLLDPAFNGFVLANNTTVSKATNTTVVGEYSLSVPDGTWVLETTIPGSPAYVNYTQVTVSTPTLTVNPVLAPASSYLTWGYVNQAAHPTTHVPTGGNVTLYDTTTGAIYSAPTPAGGFYSVGSYPAGFTGPGANTFDVVLSNVGYGTMWYPLTVSSASRGGPNPHNVLAPAISPAAVYLTTLDFSHGFGKVAVTTNATLSNDSTFPEWANASVGQLWGQLGLDFSGTPTFAMTSYPALMAALQSAGPFFPAGQSMLTVNGTGFGQPTNFSMTNSTTCSGTCGLSSNANLKLGYTQSYNVTAKVAASARSYTLSFNFRHPTHAQSINYTVRLPPGYVLSAGSSPPPQTSIVPAGPSGTYTQFTLVSKPSANAGGTATLSIVKSGNLTARVNVTVANFTFSQKNVLNDSSGNYTVIVGTGENATFSAANTTYPTATNGTRFVWAFGDSGTSNTTNVTASHIYTTAGAYTGTLTVTSSGGQTNTTKFHVYASSAQPTAKISVNSTVVATPGGVNYTIVNWSSTLHFNASASALPLSSGGSVPDVLSVALFNLTATKNTWLSNLSRAAGADPTKNFTNTFLGAGKYLNGATIGGTPVAFLGWEYVLNLTIWDAAGHWSKAKLVVLVKDTEKPVPVAAVLNSAGKSIGSSGIVEGANHTAYVALSATNTTDPHNGSVGWFNWSVGNKGNTSANRTYDLPAPSGGGVPANKGIWLAPQSKPYTVNLTVTDRAGNKAWTTISLTVTVNTSTRPVLSVENLTAPSSMTDGTQYTLWVNVTNTVGKNSTADGVQVLFYLLPSSGSGTQIAVGGSPGSVVWYGYTNGTVNSTSAGTGSINIRYNQTFRAVVHWTPSRTGTWGLWANATATNEFAANYVAGGNQAHLSVDLKQNPLVFDEEVVTIVVVAIAVIVAIVFFWRRGGIRGGGSKASTSKGSSSKSGLERGSSKKDEDDDDDEP